MKWGAYRSAELTAEAVRYVTHKRLLILLREQSAKAFAHWVMVLLLNCFIARLATLSTREWYANPKLFRRFGPEVNPLQRKLSWQDYLNKASTAIVWKYPALVVEQLQHQNMSRSARDTVSRPGKRVRCKSGLNRSLRDAGLGPFLEMLEYKCRWNGRHFKRVDPGYTSRKCANCGHTAPENRPTQAQFRCWNCVQADHADINAPKNIRDLGRISGSQYGQGLRALPVSA